LVPVAPVHIEPFGLYSTSIADVDAIPDYAEFALPSDPVNGESTREFITTTYAGQVLAAF
jgi:ABC-type metal ion transport system substrate-binding protein